MLNLLKNLTYTFRVLKVKPQNILQLFESSCEVISPKCPLHEQTTNLSGSTNRYDDVDRDKDVLCC